jgi:HemY protein
MIRIILFLALIAALAAGAAWVADQPGDVVLSWGGWRAETSLPVFALGIGIVVAVAMMIWSILRGLWRTPGRMRRRRLERRQARGRHAITQGLLAVGHGDASAARRHAGEARSAPSAPWPNERIRACSACAASSSRRSAPTTRSPP